MDGPRTRSNTNWTYQVNFCKEYKSCGVGAWEGIWEYLGVEFGTEYNQNSLYEILQELIFEKKEMWFDLLHKENDHLDLLRLFFPETQKMASNFTSKMGYGTLTLGRRDTRRKKEIN